MDVWRTKRQNIMIELQQILRGLLDGQITVGKAERMILSLLAENTEVVSSAQSESSVYTDVGESHASGDTEQNEALVEGALEKITEAEKVINQFQEYCFSKRDRIEFLNALNVSGAWINHLKDS